MPVVGRFSGLARCAQLSTGVVRCTWCGLRSSGDSAGWYCEQCVRVVILYEHREIQPELVRDSPPLLPSPPPLPPDVLNTQAKSWAPVDAEEDGSHEMSRTSTLRRAAVLARHGRAGAGTASADTAVTVVSRNVTAPNNLRDRWVVLGGGTTSPRRLRRRETQPGGGHTPVSRGFWPGSSWGTALTEDSSQRIGPL